MKTLTRSRPLPERGSSLMVTLLVTLLLGFTLASYLMLVRSEHASTARSQAWHQALVLAEAGVEEALAQLNPSINPTTLTTEVTGGNGWSLEDGFFEPDPPERTLVGGRYAVVYTPANPPTIYSTGYVKLPPGAGVLSRVVRVETTNAPLYAGGLNVQRISNPLGRVYYLDHYDSTKPQFSVNGDYDPGRTSLARTTNPAVTLRSEQPDVREPYATGLPLPTKVGNTYYLSGNYFVNGNLFLGGTDEARVPANHTATIYVTGSLFMYSDSEFHIEEGGALRVFVAGSTALLGKVDNSGTPQAFQYFGLPGNTTVTLNQPGSWFVGNFFAPQATFACTSASSTTDFAGSLSVSNLVLNRTYNFHYDESLARKGPRRGFVVAQWSEL